MFRLYKIKKTSFLSYLLLVFCLLFLLKWGAILVSYGYLLGQMQWRWIVYFVAMVIQGDFFLWGILLGIAYLAEFLNKKFWRVLIQIFILFAVVIVFADIATMFVYQQRFSFSLVSWMFSTMNSVVGLYIVGFFLGVAAVFGVALLLSKVMRFWLRNHAILLLIWGSILFKLVPMPILHVSGGELPVENTFGLLILISLIWQNRIMIEVKIKLELRHLISLFFWRLRSRGKLIMRWTHGCV